MLLARSPSSRSRVKAPYSPIRDVHSVVCRAAWMLDKSGSYTLVSGKLSVLLDLTSNGCDCSQSTAGQRPTYDASTMAAKPAMLIDANASGGMVVANLHTFLSGNDQAVTVVCAIQNVDAARNAAILNSSDAAGQTIRFRIATAAGKLGIFKRDDAAANVTLATTVATGTSAQVVSFVHEGTTSSIFQNGAATSVATSAQDVGQMTNTGTLLGDYGADAPISYFARGFVYVGAMSACDRKTLERWLGLYMGVAVT